MLIMAGILLFFLLIGAIKWEIPVIETTVVKITDPQTKYLPKLRGLSPRANCTDRAAAAGRRS